MPFTKAETCLAAHWLAGYVRLFRSGTVLKPATTVTKVCRILAQFKGQPSLGITEIARRTGLLPSDVHRLLDSLRSYGYVEQDGETRRYGIGPELLNLSARQLAAPAVQRTSSRATNE